MYNATDNKSRSIFLRWIFLRIGEITYEENILTSFSVNSQLPGHVATVASFFSQPLSEHVISLTKSSFLSSFQ